MIGALAPAIMMAALLAVHLEQRGLRPAAGAAKLLASAGYLALAGQLGFTSGPVLAAVLLCFVGDAALLGRSHPALLVGIAAFFLAHLAYAQAMVRRGLDLGWLAVAALFVFPAAILFERWLAPKVGRLRPAIILYVAAVSGMVALAASTAGFRFGPAILVGAGAFWLSDVAVALRRFLAEAPWARAVGLPLYYAAQLLLLVGLAER